MWTMSIVRPALRALARSPLLTATISISLALGIGAVMAVFLIADTVLWRQLPFPAPDRIVEISLASTRKEANTSGRISILDLLDFDRADGIFSTVAALSEESYVLPLRGTSERTAGARVTSGFFQVFGSQPERGAVREETWSTPGARLAVVSHAFWSERLGHSPTVVGSALRLDDKTYTVVGVMPPSFEVASSAQVWLPLDVTDPDVGADQRGARYLRAYGRLREGLSLKAASRELRTLSAILANRYPENRDLLTAITPIRETLFGELRPLLRLLAVAAGFIFLIVCLNVSGVLVAHTASRRGDYWVRRALGASPGLIIRAVVVQNLLLALLGGALGVLAGFLGSRLLIALRPGAYGTALQLTFPASSFAAAIGLALLAGLAVSLPVTLEVRDEASPGRSLLGSRRATVRLQALLVGFQIASTLAILYGAGLALRSVARILAVSPGFEARGVLSARIELPPYRYREPYRREQFFAHLFERLERSPGVRSAAGTTNLPLSGSDMIFGFAPLGEDSASPPRPSDPPRAHYRAISSRYFETLRIPLVAGRSFSPIDREDSPAVAIVNQAFVRRYFADRGAIGREIRLFYGGGGPLEVVGVVGDLRHGGLTRNPEPEIYVPFAQQPWSFLSLAVRTEGEPAAAIPRLRAVVASLDPEVPLDGIAPLSDLVDASTAQPRRLGMMLGILALLAAITAAVGIYGIASYWANTRRREIGLHMALGATPADIHGLSLRRPLAVTLAGLGLGTAGALLFGRVLGSLLFEISPRDPQTLLATAAALLAVAALAAWLPARRAARIDPARVLNED